MYINYVRQQGKLSEVVRQAPEKTGARETQWSGKASTRIRPNAWHLQDPISHGEEGTCNLLPVQWWWFAWVNALCNLLCKKSRVVAASLPGQFLSRHCFMLCITMEVEPRIVKQYKCDHCSSCKNYQGGKKVSLRHFWADQKIAISRKYFVLGHPLAQAASYCLLPDTFWLLASKNAFKVSSVKFTNSLSPPSIVKKVHTGSKSSQET